MDGGSASDYFDQFIVQAKEYDPLLLWGVLRSKVLPTVSLWDMTIDKAVLRAQYSQLGHVPVEKLKALLDEVDNLLDEVTQLLQHCCTVKVKEELPVKDETVKAAAVQQSGSETDLALSERLVKLLGKEHQYLQLKMSEEFPQQYMDRLMSSDLGMATFADDQSFPMLKEENDEDVVDDNDDDDDDDDNDADYIDENLPVGMKQEEKIVPTAKKVKRKTKKKVGGDATNNSPKEKPKKTYQCTICKKIFTVKVSYFRHKRVKTCSPIPQPPAWYKMLGTKYVCTHPDCGTPDGVPKENTPIYNSRTSFWRHLVDNHITEEDMRFQCEMCPEKFAYRAMLRGHITARHDKKHTCEECGKCFSYPNHLKKHMRSHTGEKPLMCDKCDYRTQSYDSLKFHKANKHGDMTNIIPHVCEVCGKSFFTAAKLKEHTFTHTDIKRFTCPICGRQLKNDSCYRRHMVCVHGQKFTCEVCVKDFSSLIGYNRHRKVEHNIKV